MVVTAGGNVPVPARGDVRIDAYRDSRRRSSAALCASRFLLQHLQFAFRLDVEEQDAWSRAALSAAVLQRFADFLTAFSHAGKNNTLTRHPNLTQAIKFSAGNDVEAATEFGQTSQDAQIAVGLYREA
jgi:hypothetical protein